MNETIIILSPGFSANEEDTNCLPSLQVFVKAFKRTNPLLNIIVIAFQYPFVSKSYTWHGVNIISLAGKNKPGLNRLNNWLKAWRILKKLHRENNITGLLSFWLGECALIGNLFGRKYDIKHYCWLLGQDARKGNRYYNLIRPTGNELIAISDSVKKEFYKNYAINIGTVVPIGIDNDMYDFKSLSRDIDILGAGSFIPLKQYDLFIEIISEVKKTQPFIKSVILGEGKERNNLQQLIEDKGLRNHLTLPGSLPHTETIHYMQRSKIFLHTSSYEGFSTVCAEALRAGAHVISFCKPMDIDFPHWHIVETKEEMLEECLLLLNNNRTDEAVSIGAIEHTISRINYLLNISNNSSAIFLKESSLSK